jgi:outer membrane protein assembly factor BamB
MSPDRQTMAAAAVVGVLLVGGSLGLFLLFSSSDDRAAPSSAVAETTATAGADSTQPPGTTETDADPTTIGSTVDDTAAATSSPTTTITEPPPRGGVGEPWGNTVSGVLTFRGNLTNTWYGTGPVPETPQALWRYPDSPMGSNDLDGVPWEGVTYTGQPLVWERPDGISELIFGATDSRLHFVDAETGEPTRPSFYTSPGGHIKGTPTLDPDGYPLVYFGSRDHRLRIVAFDRETPEELWQTNVTELEGRWWRDWDASPIIVDDIMFEGGENSFFYIWKLNRGYDNDGKVTVAPRLLFKMETWNQELMDAISPSGYTATSVEGTAAYFEGTLYFANSAGRVIGLDVTNVESGEAPIVFDYWVGDDVDAATVVDEEGMLYVSVEYERYTTRSRELGQLVKLDPTRPDEPYVWGMFSLTESPFKGGMWATPALGDGVLYAVTNKGFLVAVDRETGEELWVDDIGSGSYSAPRHMSSPVVVDGHLVLAIVDGRLRSYDLTDPRNPTLEWEYQVSTYIEATPIVWDGTIFIGARDGFMYAIGE